MLGWAFAKWTGTAVRAYTNRYRKANALMAPSTSPWPNQTLDQSGRSGGNQVER